MTTVSTMDAPASGLDCSARTSWRSLGALLGNAKYVNMLATVATQFTMLGMFVVQAMLLARILGPDARGQYGTAVFYSQLLVFPGLMGTLLSIARRGAQPGCDLQSLRRSALRMGLWMGLVNLALVVALSVLLLPAEKRFLIPLCIMCGMTLPLEQMRLAILAVDHGAEHFRRYNANRLLATAMFPVLLLVVWLLGLGSVTAVVVTFMASCLFSLAALWWTLSRPSLWRRGEPTPGTLVREGIPYGMAQISSGLFDKLDAFLILWLTGFLVQGYYTAAVPAASMLLTVPQAVALFAFNTGARGKERLTLKRLALLGLALLAVQAASAVFMALFAAPLVTLVYGKDFSGSVPFLLALLPAFAINGLGRVAEAYLQGRSQAQVGVWSRLLGAVAICIGTWLLFPRYGAMSVPLAAILGHTVMTVCICGVLVASLRSKEDSSLIGATQA